MSELYEMALTAAVGVAVLYAITRPEKPQQHQPQYQQQQQQQPIAVRYEPAPVPIAATAAAAAAAPVSAPVPVPEAEPCASEPVPVATTPIRAPASLGANAAGSSAPTQLETPSWMAKEPSFQDAAAETSAAVKTLSIPATIAEEAPSWFSAKPVSEIPPELVHEWKASSHGPTAASAASAAPSALLNSINAAVTHTAFVESEAVFVYPVGASAFLGEALRAHKSDKIHFVETREGAGEMVLGAAAATASGKVSVLLSSYSLRPMLPALKRMLHERIPAAFHISLLGGAEEEGAAVQCDHTALATIRSLPNAVVLVSANPVEAETLAKTAILLAHKLRRPVFHVFDHATMNVSVASTGAASAPATAELPSTPFVYSGSATARVALVAMGQASTEMEAFVARHSDLGALRVRVLRPWNAHDLVRALPRTVSRVCVLDQTGDALALFTDVAKSFASASAAGASQVQVSFCRVPPSARGVTTQLIHSACHELGVAMQHVGQPEPHTICVFAAARFRARPKPLLDGEHVLRFATYADYFANVSLTEVRLGDAQEEEVNYAGSNAYGVLEPGHAQVVALHGDLDALLDSGVDLLAPLVEGGLLLLPQGESVPSALHRKAKAKLAKLAHYAATSADAPIAAALQALHHGSNALLSAHTSDSNASNANAGGSNSARRIKGDVFSGHDASNASVTAMDAASSVNGHGDAGIFGLIPRLDFAHDDAATAFADENNYHQQTAMLNTTVRNEDKEFEVIARHEIARSLVFKEAFETTKTAAAETSGAHKEETFQVKLVLRKRLTPATYDRNIFHLEFDIAGTALQYNIGDALGVFAHNDVKEVDELIERCGFDANAFVAFNSGATSEFISVRNLLIQHLDIFGRPSKKFYVWLSQFATSRYEQLKLSHAGTDDAEAFKLGVAETVTFADLLLAHPSARPGMEELMQVVPRIKARHYSIASSMKMSPRSVSLLIVEVDWVTPKGRKRHGQCTRYLANLPLNSTVKVDVVPSVLRLPPNPAQPIVMAGLGTGMAPFRAFVQERKFQKESGIKVGPIVLYFGARHRSEEWLYGEEWEQYEREGLVTRLGLAFSRDQQEKIYIQHRIMEDATLLHNLFLKQEGYFYLCGPTWPVPDVRDAMAMGLDPDNAKQGNTEIIERLKDEGRYILEVY